MIPPQARDSRAHLLGLLALTLLSCRTTEPSRRDTLAEAPAPDVTAPPAAAGSASAAHRAPTLISRQQIAARLRLPPGLAARRDELAGQVAAAQGVIEGFAARHGWSARLRDFFPRGVEIVERQDELWRRILSLNKLPRNKPLPTAGLAAALEKEVLLAVTPEEYRRVQPDYAGAAGAYPRLLAHEIAHRLHVALLDGQEDAMGPRWFYEGFAVVVAGDLPSPPLDLTEALQATKAEGAGSYRRHAAALRYFMTRLPLDELVRLAGAPDFDQRLRLLCCAP